MYVRDLALHLRERGITPLVYSPIIGAVAKEIASFGIPVVNKLKALPKTPDVMHLHHQVAALTPLLLYQSIPAIYLSHESVDLFGPPPLPHRYVELASVDLRCQERMQRVVGENRTIRIIHNGVDTTRFKLRSALPSRPRRAAIFSNYVGRTELLQNIETACHHLGLSLDVIGLASDNAADQPENLLGNYDLVFAKARCALEAMAAGCAVILCDVAGLGPMVTKAEVAHLRDWNFGVRLLNETPTIEALCERIAAYDAEDATAVSQYVRAEASLDRMVDKLIVLYKDVLQAPRLPSATCLQLLGEYCAQTVRSKRIRTATRDLGKAFLFRQAPLLFGLLAKHK